MTINFKICFIIQFGGENICLLGNGEGGVIKIVIEPLPYATRGVIAGIVCVFNVVTSVKVMSIKI